jgi:hypothetical protein
MNRLDFFKRLGIGVGMVALRPRTLLDQTPPKLEKTEPKPKVQNCTSSHGGYGTNGSISYKERIQILHENLRSHHENLQRI